jgi:excisionase family DNA binding protein
MMCALVIKRTAQLYIIPLNCSILKQNEANANEKGGSMAEGDMSENQYFTTAEVAKMLKLNPFTVLTYIRNGKLGASKIGKGYRIAKGDIDAFISRGYSAAGTDIQPEEG